MENSDFFLVVPPGLEELGLAELYEKMPGLDSPRTTVGGVEFAAPFEVGLAANLILKVPTAVLLRIAQFKCRDLPKLFQKVSNIRWGRYLVGNAYELSVASSKSRLLHEKKIAGSVEEGIARHFEKQPPKKVEKPFAMEVQVRFYDDECTISLNLSGEPLFKRGYKKMEALAPLRENLGAALFYSLWRETSGFAELIDPMCGTGTFLLEAASFWQPSVQREFAFQKRVDWKAATVEVIAPEKLEQIQGYDRTAEPLQALQESLANLELGGLKLHVAVRDVLANDPIELLAPQDFAFICNPPYGERIRLPKPPKQFYPELLQKMFSFSPKAVGVILPKTFAELVPMSMAGYTSRQELKFKNGGLPVVFRVYRKS